MHKTLERQAPSRFQSRHLDIAIHRLSFAREKNDLLSLRRICRGRFSRSRSEADSEDTFLRCRSDAYLAGLTGRSTVDCRLAE